MTVLFTGDRRVLIPDCSREPARGKSYLIGHRKDREQARGYNGLAKLSGKLTALYLIQAAD